MHEIVSIQSGSSANYLGTHFWNAQDTYQTYEDPAPSSTGSTSIAAAPLVDHDVHFRAGRAADGTETYLPRTLIYDLKGGFGSLARVNMLGALDHAATEGRNDALW
jgi:Misato Segment II tubulin-like domain